MSSPFNAGHQPDLGTTDVEYQWGRRGPVRDCSRGSQDGWAFLIIKWLLAFFSLMKTSFYDIFMMASRPIKGVA